MANPEFSRSRALRFLVELKWPLTRKFIIIRLFIPYLIFLLFFNLYATYVFELEDRNPEKYAGADIFFKILLLIFSTYFIVNEIL